MHDCVKEKNKTIYTEKKILSILSYSTCINETNSKM